jgi:TusA-related sulfurtransferase
VPVDLVRNKIIKLFNTNQFSKNDIKEILETEYEVILIAKSEESLLKKRKVN